MSSTILYVPIARDELSSVIVTLRAGLDQIETKEFKDAAKLVHERLVNLLLMCSHTEKNED